MSIKTPTKHKFNIIDIIIPLLFAMKLNETLLTPVQNRMLLRMLVRKANTHCHTLLHRIATIKGSLWKLNKELFREHFFHALWERTFFSEQEIFQ